MELIQNILQKRGHEITTSDEDDSEEGEDFKDVEFCRFCRLPGTISFILIEPCHCLERHFRMAHVSCLIHWINYNLTKECPKCDTTYDCIHKIIPLRGWKTNPDQVESQHCSIFFSAIILGLLDGFVIYMVWLTTLPIELRIFFIILLFAMYVAGMVAACSRCVLLYREMYIYNCPVVEVLQTPKQQSTGRLMADHFLKFQSVLVAGVVEKLPKL